MTIGLFEPKLLSMKKEIPHFVRNDNGVVGRQRDFGHMPEIAIVSSSMNLSFRMKRSVMRNLVSWFRQPDSQFYLISESVASIFYLFHNRKLNPAVFLPAFGRGVGSNGAC